MKHQRIFDMNDLSKRRSSLLHAQTPDLIPRESPYYSPNIEYIGRKANANPRIHRTPEVALNRFSAMFLSSGDGDMATHPG